MRNKLAVIFSASPLSESAQSSTVLLRIHFSSAHSKKLAINQFLQFVPENSYIQWETLYQNHLETASLSACALSNTKDDMSPTWVRLLPLNWPTLSRATLLSLQLCWWALEWEGPLSGKKGVRNTNVPTTERSLEIDMKGKGRKMLGSLQRKMKSVDSDKGCRAPNTIGLTGVPGFSNKAVTSNLGKSSLCEVRRNQKQWVEWGAKKTEMIISKEARMLLTKEEIHEDLTRIFSSYFFFLVKEWPWLRLIIPSLYHPQFSFF